MYPIWYCLLGFGEWMVLTILFSRVRFLKDQQTDIPKMDAHSCRKLQLRPPREDPSIWVHLVSTFIKCVLTTINFK